MTSPKAERGLAIEIVRKLRESGHQALLAGGCVRDQLLKLEPKDYDVATTATPDEIRRLFGYRRTLPIGAAFGVVTVLGRRHQGQVDVATFRSDASYSDGRHPDSVTFTDARHDAERRDFTINGLFYDPLSDEVIDYVEGQRDLQAKVVRAIGDPSLRFREDRLRMLRAVRFAAAFGFEIESRTMAAIQATAHEITSVSAERIGVEFRRMLTDRHRARALRLLRETGLLPSILPEVAELSGDDFDASADVLDALRDPTLPTALAALLLYTESDSAEIGRRFRYTNKEIERLAWLRHYLPVVREATKAYWPALQRILIHEGAGELMTLLEAVAGPADPSLQYCRERLAWTQEQLNPRPLLLGADLIAHGLAPGPEFSKLLEQVRDAQLMGQVATREEALALVDRLRRQPGTLS